MKYTLDINRDFESPWLNEFLLDARMQWNNYVEAYIKLYIKPKPKHMPVWLWHYLLNKLFYLKEGFSWEFAKKEERDLKQKLIYKIWGYLTYVQNIKPGNSYKFAEFITNEIIKILKEKT